MKKLILIPVLFLFTLINNAQTGSFEGLVIDAQLLTPIQGALVTIQGTKFVVDTDADGKFVFKDELPQGQHGVIVEKENFETEIFLIDITKDITVIAKEISLIPNKKELSRRKKEAKKLEKEQRIKDKQDKQKISEIEKLKRKKDKEREEIIKKLERKKDKGKLTNGPDIDYISNKQTTVTSNVDLKNSKIEKLQKKYGEILGVDPSIITNVELYSLIDEWNPVTYKFGGDTKNGIDCSSFTQLIYTSIYNYRLERTADLQYHSEITDPFKVREDIHEGDLVFFTGVGKDNDKINHVGLYLHNGMFVHSTSNPDENGKSGVQISNLNDKYWSTKFVAAGRQMIDD